MEDTIVVRDLPTRVRHYELRLKSRLREPRAATAYCYVSNTDTIRVVVLSNQRTTSSPGASVIFDKEIRLVEDNLRSELKNGTISGFKVPIDGPVSFRRPGQDQQYFAGRRAVVVVRLPSEVTSVHFIYVWQIGRSTIRVDTSMPADKFDDTDLVDFVNGMIELVSEPETVNRQNSG